MGCSFHRAGRNRGRLFVVIQVGWVGSLLAQGPVCVHRVLKAHLFPHFEFTHRSGSQQFGITAPSRQIHRVSAVKLFVTHCFVPFGWFVLPRFALAFVLYPGICRSQGKLDKKCQKYSGQSSMWLILWDIKPSLLARPPPKLIGGLPPSLVLIRKKQIFCPFLSGHCINPIRGFVFGFPWRRKEAPI